MMNNNKIGYLRYWCQKILPLVYDNSLSYYELLCKIERKLNEVIKNINEIPEYIDQAIDERLSDEHITELIGALIREIENAISANNEEERTNSQNDYAVGEVLWWNNKFYRVIQKIDATDMLVVGVNLESISFDEMFTEFLEGIEKDITAHDNGYTQTALETYPKGTWVWISDKLYRTKAQIIEGNAFVYTGTYQNVEELNIEVAYHELEEAIADVASDLADEIENRVDAVSDEATARIEADDALGIRIDGVISDLSDETLNRENADTTLQEHIDDEITNRENAINSVLDKIGDMSNLPTSAKNTIVASINELYDDIHAIPTTTGYSMPEHFGAVGDGTTDDTIAIQSAINAENIVVFKPNTTYMISDALYLNDNSKLIGNGATLLLKGGVKISYTEGTDDMKGLITILRLNNVEVSDLTIDVNGSTLAAYTNYEVVDNCAMVVQYSSNVTIKRCKFINLYTAGIDTHMTSYSINIENNYFKHVQQNSGLRKDCIYCVTHSGGLLNVKGNVCDEEEINNLYGCGGIFFANVRNADCGNNIVLNCGRRNQFGHPVSAICVYSECLNIVVHDNYIKSIEGIFRADASAKITFKDNYCTFNGACGYSDSDYIRMTYYDPSNFGYWGEYTISGNTIIIDDLNNGSARGIGVGHNNSRPFHSLRIENNDITMFNTAIDIYAKMNDIIIQNNRIKSTSGGYARIALTDGGDNIIIQNNTAPAIHLRRKNDSTQVCYHVDISGNSLEGGNDAIRIDYTSYATIHDNNMQGYFEADSGLYGVIVHDNVAHNSSSGLGYYGSVTGQHDNYYNNSLVGSFS